jgi:NYN domain
MPGKDGEAVDRCALFVDAGYVLADGAMAVHGTRRGESVSWDYEGLLQLLSSLARERTGLPLLRCYWYEATVDGGRTDQQEALADVPGIKLRVAKIRPGRREGVETEIHRDLTTLARNNAISDALVLSAEEDLAQAIADVQDLGLRVTLVHIAMDGNWTIARALRQESDDIIEIGAEQLRPYVELIAGAEPAQAEEPVGAEPAAARPLANGHAAGAGPYQQVPAGAAGPGAAAMYAAPVAAEYQRAALQLPRVAAREDRPREDRPRDDRSRDDRPREDRPREDRPREDRTAQPAMNGDAQASSRQDVYAASPTVARPRLDRPEPVPPPDAVSGLAGVPGQEPAQAAPGQLRRLPARSAGQQPGGPAGPMGGSMGPMGSAPGAPHGGQGQGIQGVQGPARGSRFSGPQPVATSPAPGYQSAGSGVGVSLAEAVQAAHEEGQEFGGSVARDAPALWLEAVLARKPRMPSDLEARLLQGSALPIDYLLHDEVRHALRRGFWDALERTRR